MKIGRVVNNVWATRKDDSLIGMKFMIIRLLDDTDGQEGPFLVAADIIGAGIGEKVLITFGSSARQMAGLEQTPVDATIIGIIDEEDNKSYEVAKT